MLPQINGLDVTWHQETGYWYWFREPNWLQVLGLKWEPTLPTKPFSMRNWSPVVAPCCAVSAFGLKTHKMRRSKRSPSSSRAAHCPEGRKSTFPKGIRLLDLFMKSSPPSLVTRTLMTASLGVDLKRKSVDVHIRWREKLEPDLSHPNIVTVRVCLSILVRGCC